MEFASILFAGFLLTLIFFYIVLLLFHSGFFKFVPMGEYDMQNHWWWLIEPKLSHSFDKYLSSMPKYSVALHVSTFEIYPAIDQAHLFIKSWRLKCIHTVWLATSSVWWCPILTYCEYLVLFAFLLVRPQTFCSIVTRCPFRYLNSIKFLKPFLNINSKYTQKYEAYIT